MGTSDYLFVDQGYACTSKRMKEALEEVGIRLDEAPIEKPCEIGTVERYHAPPCLAYERICADTGREQVIKNVCS